MVSGAGAICVPTFPPISAATHQREATLCQAATLPLVRLSSGYFETIFGGAFYFLTPAKVGTQPNRSQMASLSCCSLYFKVVTIPCFAVVTSKSVMHPVFDAAPSIASHRSLRCDASPASLAHHHPGTQRTSGSEKTFGRGSQNNFKTDRADKKANTFEKECVIHN